MRRPSSHDWLLISGVTLVIALIIVVVVISSGGGNKSSSHSSSALNQAPDIHIAAGSVSLPGPTGFSFQYPASWKATTKENSSKNTVVLLSPNSALPADTELLFARTGGQIMSLKGLLEALTAGGKSSQYFSSVSEKAITLGGIPGYYVNAVSRVGALHGITWATFQNGYAYTFTLGTPSASAAASLAPEMEKIALSLVLPKTQAPTATHSLVLPAKPKKPSSSAKR